MLIMAIDSASHGCSVAVWQDGTVLASCDQSLPERQAEILVPMVQAVLDKARLSFADIDLFAVTVGPGSFTGVRVGLATARGLGLAAARPVAGVTTTETVAWIARSDNRINNDPNHCIVVILDTRRADFYVQSFLLEDRLPSPLCPVQTLALTAVRDFLADLPPLATVVSNNITRLTAYLPTTIPVVSGIRPQAWAAAAVAAARESTGRLAAEPLYLAPAMTMAPAKGHL
ncbi:TsaB protein, required for threonylcarbamoyladenosine (t(6)A) formation in tRNA [invertebrate metagenome]|uniref:TsaB protein, required for threonylcarbamoyladenosine (T(6)A) formation in tRNA n=1 Tax=invertebrate metagenome TaxID=1711999 RepID=A0A484H6H0_9ZZZZ